MEQKKIEERQEETIESGDRFASLKKVTPLTKYLAMLLFIIMPFIGGLIGYTYAPEKVVEVERIVEVAGFQQDIQVQYANDNIDASSRSYVVGEYVTLNIPPLSDRRLEFEVWAYRRKSDPFYSDRVHFNSINGKVTLDGYSYENSENLLLTLIPYDKSLDLEITLEAELLNIWTNNSDMTAEEVDNLNDENTRKFLLSEFPNKNFSDVTWRELCELRSWVLGNTTYYILDYDNEKYNDFSLGFYCGSGSYEIHENILIHNPGVPVDAEEPKVRRGSVKLLNY